MANASPINAKITGGLMMFEKIRAARTIPCVLPAVSRGILIIEWLDLTRLLVDAGEPLPTFDQWLAARAILGKGMSDDRYCQQAPIIAR
jgi:hypothetical protein